MPRIGALCLTVALVACASARDGSTDSDRAAAVVVVPNTIIESLVERVACGGGVDAIVGDTDAVGSTDPVLEVVLESRALAGEATDSAAVVSVVDSSRTIDVGDGQDPWVWLDPARTVDLVRTLGAALVAQSVVEASTIDRCLARVEGELEALRTDLLALADGLDDDRRIIAVDAPGTVYVADGLGFQLDISSPAARAGEIMSTDSLDGYDTYEEMMRAHLGEAVELLANPGG